MTHTVGDFGGNDFLQYFIVICFAFYISTTELTEISHCESTYIYDSIVSQSHRVPMSPEDRCHCCSFDHKTYLYESTDTRSSSPSTLPVCRAKMLLAILLMNLVLCRASAGADAKSPPKEGLEDLAEKLEFRLRDVETRMHQKDKEMESKEKEMKTRLEELEDKMKEEEDASEKREMELKASMSKLRMEVQEYSNCTNEALMNSARSSNCSHLCLSVWSPHISPNCDV